MTMRSRVAGWLADRPLLWGGALILLVLLLGLFVVAGPLSSLKAGLLIVAIVIGIALFVEARASRLPVDICFLAFVVLLPATRFSVLDIGFSLQANFVALVATTGLVLWRAGSLHLPLKVPHSRIHAPIAALFLIILLSFFLSAQVPAEGFRGELPYVRSAKQILNLILMLVTYVTVLLVVKRRRLFRWAIWAFIGTSFVVSLYGIYQFVAYPLHLPLVDLFPQSDSFGQSNVWAIALAGGRFLRVWSVASEPVWFGDYLVGVIPLAVALVMNEAGIGKRYKSLLIVGLVTMFFALLLTFARSAYLALAVGGLTLLAFRPRLLTRGIVLVVALAGAIGIVSLAVSQIPAINDASLVEAVSERFISPFEDEYFGNIHRATSLSTSLAMFQARPWGVGYGNYGFFFYDYMPSWGRAMTDVWPDAFPVMSGGILLRLLTETSLPGAIAFLWLVLTVLLEGIRTVRRYAGDAFMQAASLGFLAGFLALVARLQMADSIHFTYQWFILGMIVVASRLSRQSDMDWNVPHSRLRRQRGRPPQEIA